LNVNGPGGVEIGPLSCGRCQRSAWSSECIGVEPYALVIRRKTFNG
jgi:hypothetical protein